MGQAVRNGTIPQANPFLLTLNVNGPMSYRVLSK